MNNPISNPPIANINLSKKSGFISVLQLIRLRTILSPFILGIYSASFYLGNFKGFCHAFALFLANAAIMVLNDLQDKYIDQEHPTKKNRPIISLKISENKALTLLLVALILSIVIEAAVYRISFAYILFLLIGITYTKFLKPLSWFTKNGFVALSWVLNIYLCGSYLDGILLSSFYPLYFIIFLWGLRYEISKDIEDRIVDKKHGVSTLVNLITLKNIPYAIATINIFQWIIWFTIPSSERTMSSIFLAFALILVSFFDVIYMIYCIIKKDSIFSKFHYIFTIHRLAIFCTIFYFMHSRWI